MGSEKLSDDKGWVISSDNKKMNQVNVVEWEEEKNPGNLQRPVDKETGIKRPDPSRERQRPRESAGVAGKGWQAAGMSEWATAGVRRRMRKDRLVNGKMMSELVNLSDDEWADDTHLTADGERPRERGRRRRQPRGAEDAGTPETRRL